jgi:hypothetical protein
MLTYILFGLALAAAIILGVRGIAAASQARAFNALTLAALATAAAIGLLYLVTRRPAFIAIALIAAAVVATGMVLGRRRARRAPSRSQVTTRYLRLELDHVTGAVAGDILDGPFLGRRIEALLVEELVELYRFCLSGDAQSARLVEAYLDRTSPTWRERHGSGAATSSAPMGRAEALAVLGLDEGATAEQIRAAHRRLMQQHHPDRGGSPEAAARINRARDILLGE